MYSSEKYRERLRKARENNVCPNCGKPMDRDGYYCSICSSKNTMQKKKRSEQFKEMGLCPKCGKEELFGNEKLCLECSAKSYGYSMKNRKRNHYNKVHREWERKTYLKMVEQGICTRCRKAKAEYGYKTCRTCRLKLRDFKRMKYGKPNRQERYKDGLCFFCDNPIKAGYKVCEKHYNACVEKARSKNSEESRKKLIKDGILY